MKSISILGCGWLGLPLAKRLQVEGYQVKGSTTSINKVDLLKENGIEPHLVILNPDVRTDRIQDFLNSEILIIDIPPMRNKNVLELFPSQIKYLIKEIEASPIDYVIFISSTSVYDDNDQTVNEESELNPSKDSGKALVIAEGLLRAVKLVTTTIIRFGGLIGPDRHPGRFLAGRKNISGGDTKVNLIHLDDCIDIISTIIKQNIWGEILNAAADEHPTRKELYTKTAKSMNLEVPVFTSESCNYKIVSSDKLKEKIKYNFKFPNPLEMF